MTWLDVLLLLAVGTSIVTGWMTGFARVIIGFAALILAFVLAAWFYGPAAHLIAPLIGHKTVADVMGFGLVFMLVILAGGLVSRVVRAVFKVTGLSILDRFAGAAFGLVRGILVAVLLVTVLLSFAPQKVSAVVAQSRLSPYVLEASGAISAATPHELKEAFQIGYGEVRNALQQALQQHHAKKRKPAAGE